MLPFSTDSGVLISSREVIWRSLEMISNPRGGLGVSVLDILRDSTIDFDSDNTSSLHSGRSTSVSGSGSRGGPWGLPFFSKVFGLIPDEHSSQLLSVARIRRGEVLDCNGNGDGNGSTSLSLPLATVGRKSWTGGLREREALSNRERSESTEKNYFVKARQISGYPFETFNFLFNNHCTK